MSEWETEARAILDGGPAPSRLSRELTAEVIRQLRNRVSDGAVAAGRIAELTTEVQRLERENLQLVQEIEQVTGENRDLKRAASAAKAVRR